MLTTASFLNTQLSCCCEMECDEKDLKKKKNPNTTFKKQQRQRQEELPDIS